MTIELTTIAAAGLSLAVYLLTVAIVLRLFAQAHALLLLVGSAVLVFAVAIFAIVIWSHGRILFWHFLAFYCSGVAATIFLYGAVLKSLSLQMCAQLGVHNNCGVDKLADAVIRTEFEKRITLLENGGLVERQEAGFMATAQGRVMATRISAVRHILRIESTGLYAATQKDQ